MGHVAIDRDLRVGWLTLEALTATTVRCRTDASTGNAVERIVRSELIVVDDVGLLFPRGLATTAVDRLLHHAHVVVTEGRSHRLTEATEVRGVSPLAAGLSHKERHVTRSRVVRQHYPEQGSHRQGKP